jgi:hypothetical protein
MLTNKRSCVLTPGILSMCVAFFAFLPRTTYASPTTRLPRSCYIKPLVVSLLEHTTTTVDTHHLDMVRNKKTARPYCRVDKAHLVSEEGQASPVTEELPSHLLTIHPDPSHHTPASPSIKTKAKGIWRMTNIEHDSYT